MPFGVDVSISVSVIIPAWNAQETIERCLDSLARQSVNPAETILVDDGSDDMTVRLAEKYNVKVVSTGGRKGPATARNMGAESASGDVLLFLDSDVTVPANLIKTVTRHFSDERVWAVQTLYSPVCPADDIVSRYQNYYYWHSLNRMSGEITATFATWCAAIRRDRFMEIGGFNVRIPEPTVEDEELGYSIADRGGRIILEKSILVDHLASYTLSQFTRRRLRMARAQAKSGWREVRNRLLARYINVRESGTHHSRWVVLSILLTLAAQLSAVASAVMLSPAAALAVPALLAMSLICHGRFLLKATGHLGRSVLIPFSALCLYDMAVLGWGITHGSIQFLFGRRY